MSFISICNAGLSVRYLVILISTSVFMFAIPCGALQIPLRRTAYIKHFKGISETPLTIKEIYKRISIHLYC